MEEPTIRVQRRGEVPTSEKVSEAYFKEDNTQGHKYAIRTESGFARFVVLRNDEPVDTGHARFFSLEMLEAMYDRKIDWEEVPVSIRRQLQVDPLQFPELD